jgi:hypothetical protein
VHGCITQSELNTSRMRSVCWHHQHPQPHHKLLYHSQYFWAPYSLAIRKFCSTATMTTLTTEGLETLLSNLGAETPIPEHLGAITLHRPLDIARLYLADILKQLAPEHANNAYGAIAVTSSVDHGDLTVIVPKLDHECEAELYALELMRRVCPYPKSI